MLTRPNEIHSLSEKKKCKMIAKNVSLKTHSENEKDNKFAIKCGQLSAI